MGLLSAGLNLPGTAIHGKIGVMEEVLCGMYFIGIDLGTTGVKAVVFTEDGRIAAMAYEAYRQEAVKGKRELRAEALWESCERVLAAAMGQCPVQEEGALCVSSFGEGFVCLDGNGRELTPVMLLTDDRGTEEFGQVVWELEDGRIAEITGLKPHISYSLSKILYLRSHQPEVYKKTEHILLMGDHLYHKLGGGYVTDYSMASRTMLFDVHQKRWDPWLLEKTGVEAALFSRPVQGGSVVGEVSRAVAERLSLPRKTWLVMGGHDQPVAAVASRGGHGYTMCSMGTSECITPVLQRPLSGSHVLACGHPNEPFMEPDVYNTLAYNVTSGLLTEWAAKVFTKKEREQGRQAYQILEREMPKKPTRILVLPYLHGSGTPYLDAEARLSMLGLDEADRRGDIYRGILEGLCMDQKLNIEKLGADKLEPAGLLVTGGSSRSQAWLQIKADVLERPIHRLECAQAGALGCAILCASALKIYPSLKEAARAMVQVGTAVEPRKEESRIYREKYEIYKTLYEDCRRANAYAAGFQR